MNIQPQPAAYIADPKIASLASGFAQKISDPAQPANFPKAILRYRNDRWSRSVGLDGLTDEQWTAHFGRFEPLPGNMAVPLALAYHGHQFRNYNPEIGDGRGFLFAQLRGHDGRLLDLGTKGSGTTRYSRGGDGRLTLKGGIREILATEMLEALGVETSKTFSLIETGEGLMRGDEPSPARSSVLVRLSHSHIRFGSFQRIAFNRDGELMQQLTDYCMQYLYNQGVGPHDPEALFALVADRVADQAAAYMAAGFVHGVLNTDNINITGESFDYGPWRFTPFWDARFTAAYFDENGLYAFGRQAEAMHWNLSQLAVSLRLICAAEPLIAALDNFPALFQKHLIRRFLWRMGALPQNEAQDRALVAAAERLMIAGKIPVAQFFHDCRARRMGANAGLVEPSESPDGGEVAAAAFAQLFAQYQLDTEANHAYWQSAPICSMGIEEVETIWAAIAESDDWQPLSAKIAQIRAMGDALRFPAATI